ncbi:superfamily 6 holin (LLH) [Tissierella praeacuta]|uniref:phage holin, LLH family n=1 Tax=Tissierella praeacuta TaxID=43131 RepID=UPI0010EA8E8C|nr:phage holin, LLH family [Tissierella praeacuta]TCU74216.1 superfamily 6 holin (LLH) [Tissierella praeacuta]
MNIDIIVKVIIPILGAILTYLIVPFIKSKTTKEQRENIYFWVKVAVGAAEQIYREKGEGKLKKEYVVAFLTSKGIDITMEELDVLIEAAVKELNMIKDKTLE